MYIKQAERPKKIIYDCVNLHGKQNTFIVNRSKIHEGKSKDYITCK